MHNDAQEWYTRRKKQQWSKLPQSGAGTKKDAAWNDGLYTTLSSSICKADSTCGWILFRSRWQYSQDLPATGRLYDTRESPSPPLFYISPPHHPHCFQHMQSDAPLSVQLSLRGLLHELHLKNTMFRSLLGKRGEETKLVLNISAHFTIISCSFNNFHLTGNYII